MCFHAVVSIHLSPNIAVLLPALLTLSLQLPQNCCPEQAVGWFTFWILCKAAGFFKSLFFLSGFEFLSLLWAVVKEGAVWGERWKRRPTCCEMQIRGNQCSLFASIPDVEWWMLLQLVTRALFCLHYFPLPQDTHCSVSILMVLNSLLLVAFIQTTHKIQSFLTMTP